MFENNRIKIPTRGLSFVSVVHVLLSGCGGSVEAPAIDLTGHAVDTCRGPEVRPRNTTSACGTTNGYPVPDPLKGCDDFSNTPLLLMVPSATWNQKTVESAAICDRWFPPGALGQVFETCNSNKRMFTCVWPKTPSNEVCCTAITDWEYDCHERAPGETCQRPAGGSGGTTGTGGPSPAPTAPTGPPFQTCSQYLNCGTGTSVPTTSAWNYAGLGQTPGAGGNAGTPPVANDCGGKPYVDPNYGALNPLVKNQAGPDFDCAFTGATNYRCTINPALQTTMAGRTKVFAADRVAARRAFVTDPNALPLPGKSADEVLMAPPSCGGLSTDDGEILGAGVDVAQGSFSQTFGCQVLSGGALPLQVGVRYESGTVAKQDAISCRRNNNVDTLVASGRFEWQSLRSNDLSAGWTHSFTRRVLPFSNGSEMRLYLENQRTYRFQASTKADIFVQVGLDGEALRVLDAAYLKRVPAGWELRYANGMIDLFEGAHGTLVYERDRWGNHLFVDYGFDKKPGAETYLYQRITQFVPGSNGALTPVKSVYFFSQWMWNPYQGNPALATRGYRLAAVLTSQGDPLLSLGYDGQGRVTKIAESFATAGQRVWTAISYDETGTLSALTDPMGNTLSMAYENAPEVNVSAAGSIVPTGSFTSFDPGYRRVKTQQSSFVPRDGLSSLALNYAPDGFGTVQATVGGVVDHRFDQRLRTTRAKDGTGTSYRENMFSLSGASTRTDLQIEKKYRPNGTSAGPYELVARDDFGTGMVTKSCTDGRLPESCRLLVYRDLVRLPGHTTYNDSVMPLAICNKASSDIRSIDGGCVSYGYDGPFAVQCQMPAVPLGCARCASAQPRSSWINSSW